MHIPAEHEAPWPWPVAGELNSTVVGVDDEQHLMVLDHRTGQVHKSFGKLDTWTVNALTREEMDAIFPTRHAGPAGHAAQQAAQLAPH